ncbi:MAG: hypothetical protein JXA16_10605 [Bacteroidales bacterium]|nr:hypothetical protein [Bacteroidales bacterium]
MKKSILVIVLFLCSLYIKAQTEYVNYGEINKVENYTDHFNITSGYYKSNNLILEVLYGGGCSEHQFYYTINSQIVSDTLSLTIYHNANNDVCQAFVGENLSFDLSIMSDFGNAKIIKVKSGNYTLALFPIIDAAKIDLSTAKSLIKNEFYKNIEDELVITELTTEELWQKMGTQIFRIENKGSFAIQNNKVTDLGERPYTCYLDFVVCDLNKDGNFECFYTYQFGSGVSRGILGCYSKNNLFDIDQSCIIPSYETIANFKFIKKSDYYLDLYVQTPEKQIMNGTISIENFNKIVLSSLK